MENTIDREEQSKEPTQLKLLREPTQLKLLREPTVEEWMGMDYIKKHIRNNKFKGRKRKLLYLVMQELVNDPEIRRIIEQEIRKGRDKYHQFRMILLVIRIREIIGENERVLKKKKTGLKYYP